MAYKPTQGEDSNYHSWILLLPLELDKFIEAILSLYEIIFRP